MKLKKKKIQILVVSNVTRVFVVCFFFHCNCNLISIAIRRIKSIVTKTKTEKIQEQIFEMDSLDWNPSLKRSDLNLADTHRLVTEHSLSVPNQDEIHNNKNPEITSLQSV